MPNINNVQRNEFVTYLLTRSFPRRITSLPPHLRTGAESRFRRAALSYNCQSHRSRMTLFIRRHSKNKVVLTVDDARRIVKECHVDDLTDRHRTKAETIREVLKTYDYFGVINVVDSFWPSCDRCWPGFELTMREEDAKVKRRSRDIEHSIMLKDRPLDDIEEDAAGPSHGFLARTPSITRTTTAHTGLSAQMSNISTRTVLAPIQEDATPVSASTRSRTSARSVTGDDDIPAVTSVTELVVDERGRSAMRSRTVDTRLRQQPGDTEDMRRRRVAHNREVFFRLRAEYVRDEQDGFTPRRIEPAPTMMSPSPRTMAEAVAAQDTPRNFSEATLQRQLSQSVAVGVTPAQTHSSSAVRGRGPPIASTPDAGGNSPITDTDAEAAIRRVRNPPLFYRFWAATTGPVRVSSLYHRHVLFALDDYSNLGFAVPQIEATPSAVADMIVRHTVRHSAGHDGSRREMMLPFHFTDRQVNETIMIVCSRLTVGVVPVMMRAPRDHRMLDNLRYYAFAMRQSIIFNSPHRAFTSDWHRYVPLVSDAINRDLAGLQGTHPYNKIYVLQTVELVGFEGFPAEEDDNN